MHLAAHFGIETAAHSLVRFSTGELAYVTRRFDRTRKGKLALEDFCQISETLTADKYRGSMEKVGKLLRQYSVRPGLDAITLFELTLFCFLTGNADMHLKNFSILTQQNKKTRLFEPVLAPAYDLLNTKLPIPDDTEEMALTINARKNKLKRADFDTLAAHYGIAGKALEHTYKRFERRKEGVADWVGRSFLPADLQEGYLRIFNERWARIFG